MNMFFHSVSTLVRNSFLSMLHFIQSVSYVMKFSLSVFVDSINTVHKLRILLESLQHMYKEL